MKMKATFKKFLVAACTVTMIMASASTAFAGSTSGSQITKAAKDTVDAPDVFCVAVPTSAGTIFDYVLDPEGVISETNAAKYGGKSFHVEDGKRMYFQRTTKEVSDGDVSNYEAESSSIKAINKGTGDVEVTVSATLKNASAVSMVELDNVTTGEGAKELALQVKAGENRTAAGGVGGSSVDLVTPDEKTAVTSEIAHTEGAYDVTYSESTGKYTKVLDSSVTDFEAYEFFLTGNCSPGSEWSKVTTLPTLELTWTINGDGVKVDAGDSGSNTPIPSGPTITMTTGGLITITGLTKEKNLTQAGGEYKQQVKVFKTGRTEFPIGSNGTWASNGWDATNGGGTLTVQLNDNTMTTWNGEDITAKAYLTDGSTIDCHAVLSK